MNEFPNDMTNHFLPFHQMLTELSEVADKVYPEGGMNWSVDYGHRKGHLAKIESILLHKRDDFGSPPDLHEYKHLWAKLIWKASGAFGNFDDAIDNVAWAEEEQRCIVMKYDQAEQVIEWYKTVGATKCFMSFSEDDISMSFQSVLLFNNHALSHSVFWSID